MKTRVVAATAIILTSGLIWIGIKGGLYARAGEADDARNGGATINVNMGGATNVFDPPTVNAKVGDEVVFVNVGGTHTATSDDIKTGSPKNTFNTGTMKKGQKSAIFFNAEGTYKYHCEYHGSMKGTITVTQ